MSQAKTEPQIIKPYTEEQIDAHAAKYGGRRNLREICISADGGEYHFYYLVKKPSRNVMEAIAEAGGGSAVTAAGQPHKVKDLGKIQKLMLGCVLAGDREAYEFDGGIYTQLLKEIGKLVNHAQADLKKL